VISIVSKYKNLTKEYILKKVLTPAILISTLMCFTFTSCNESKSCQTYTDNIVYRTKGKSFQNYYVEVIPDNNIKGLLVLIHGFGMSPEKFLYEMRLDNLAAEHGILTIAPTLNSWESHYFDEATLDTLDKIINEITVRHNLEGKRFIIGGFSLGGTETLRYAENFLENSGESSLSLSGVFLVDSPIDFERLWNSFIKKIQKDPDAGEANYFVSVMKSNIGEFSQENYDTYKENSPFLASAKDGGRLSLLRNLPIRFYSEPDTIWWKEQRATEYQDINIYDLKKAKAQLLELGNNQSELILSKNKGYRKDGTRHPHSWSIVDEHELLGWIKNKIEK